MQEYREEHAESNKLFVFVWVRLLSTLQAQSSPAPSDMVFEPMRIVWSEATTGLLIDGSSLNVTSTKGTSLELDVHQLPPETRRGEAVKWIDSSAGQAWAQGKPAQLMQIMIDGN